MSKGTKIYSQKCIRILLLRPIYHSAISWVPFLKINFILWPVMSGSDNKGRLWVKMRSWFMDHIFNYLRILGVRGGEGQYTPTLFSGTSGMEKWDLMSYVQQHEGNLQQTMSGSRLTSRCLLWQIWTLVSLNTRKNMKNTSKTLPIFYWHVFHINWLLLPIWF